MGWVTLKISILKFILINFSFTPKTSTSHQKKRLNIFVIKTHKFAVKKKNFNIFHRCKRFKIKKNPDNPEISARWMDHLLPGLNSRKREKKKILMCFAK